MPREPKNAKMKMSELLELMAKYGRCPECGSDKISNGEGTFAADTYDGYFERTCRCGWSVKIQK